jgi:preprotein translocase subunit SecA
MYPKLAGMTGTAMTEAEEFGEIYGLEVVEIPTNMAVCRTDDDDEVYRTAAEKYEAIIELIKECHAREQPVLVGTVSIEKSEHLAGLLKKQKIPHAVLNARFHEQEAHIIAQAGRPGVVTIATNMAGRGTDIQLGGNPDMRIADEATPLAEEAARAAAIGRIRGEVAEERGRVVGAGGLFVVGTERHESRRIDNQLRGRSGRQGDPGRSKFYLSLEDDLMRIFASDRLDGMLQRLGLKSGEAIIHPWINKALEKAQQKVEARNFDIRKNLLKFDNVMNDQRKVIYEQRREIMGAPDVAQIVVDMRHEVVSDMVQRAIPPNSYAEQWDMAALKEDTGKVLGLDLPVEAWGKEEGIAEPEIEERIRTAVDAKVAEKAANFGADTMRMVEKSLLLQILDQTWKEHLLTLDHLRQGISLRAYAQRDPLREYQAEAFQLFQDMLVHFRLTMTRVLCNVELRLTRPEEVVPRPPAPQELRETRQDPAAAEATEDAGALLPATGTYGAPPRPARAAPARAAAAGAGEWGKVPRNAPCPCGSGKKFKHCHGAT